MSLKAKLFDKVSYLFQKKGYIITIKKTCRIYPKNKLCLNIGAGSWGHEGWINLDYPTEWYSKAQSAHKFIPYDIRNDKLPFDNNSVDAIYTSHVIEHIEDEHIQTLFNECFRVLKKGGVFRITCPDAEFLYNIAKHTSYSSFWMDEHYQPYRELGREYSYVFRPVDFLAMRVGGSDKVRKHLLDPNNSDIDYLDDFASLDMDNFLIKLTKDRVFNYIIPGDHINYWTFEKIKERLVNAGFVNIIRSVNGGSCCQEMKHPGKFDITWPQESLYVEAVK